MNSIGMLTFLVINSIVFLALRVFVILKVWRLALLNFDISQPSVLVSFGLISVVQILRMKHITKSKAEVIKKLPEDKMVMAYVGATLTNHLALLIIWGLVYLATCFL